MKKIWLLCLMVVGMIACTEQNTPVDPGTSDDTKQSDTTIVTTDTIGITWNGASATITGSHENVSVTEQNGYVTVNSTVKDISYLLSGSGQGQLTIYGTNRHQLILNDLTLSCNDGPAINNQCKKSCFVVLAGSSSLADGSTYASSDEDRKAAFYSEGQMKFSGSGSLTVQGNYKHAIASDDYIQFAQSTGTLNVTANVNDGIHANDGIFIDGGTFHITSKDEGIRTDSNTIAITGGTIEVISQSEGIESKGTITISGGVVYSQATDDAINAGGDLTFSGGCVCAYSTGNDGIDANGNCYIQGGFVYAIGAGSPEVAIDANSEERKQLYVTGGTIVTLGKLESGAQLSQACYQSSSWDAETWYSISVGDETFAFHTPTKSNSGQRWAPGPGGGGHGGGGPGGDSNTPLVVSGSSKPTVMKGVTATGTTIFNGMGVKEASISGGTEVTLSSYSNNGW